MTKRISPSPLGEGRGEGRGGVGSPIFAFLILLIAFATMLLSACTVGPNFARPDLDLPKDFGVAQSPAPAAPKWWTLFQDPVLDLADLFLFAVDFLEHGAILLVGLHLIKLIFMFGDPFLNDLDFAFKVAALFLVGVQAELVFLVRMKELIQLGFDRLNP